LWELIHEGICFRMDDLLGSRCASREAPFVLCYSLRSCDQEVRKRARVRARQLEEPEGQLK